MAETEVKVKAIIPDRFELDDNLILKMLNYTDSFSRRLRRRLLDPTDTWEHKPRFEIQKGGPRSGGMIGASAYTTDENYIRIDQGTNPHIIAPKSGKSLMLKRVTPKTSPHSLEARASKVVRDPDIVSGPVEHPGIQARHFTDTVRKTAEKEFIYETKKVIDELINENMSETSHTVG